jgi:hypothetical protein
MKLQKVILSAAMAVAAPAVGFVVAAPATAEPGYGSDCILPSVSECRLVPDGDGPHMVQVWCPDTNSYVSVFAPCPGRYTGPYN